jgi:hypothetical protein
VKEGEEKKEQVVKSMGELLFKGVFDDIEMVTLADLFANESIALNVVESQTSPALQLTPKKLFAEIKTVAEKRY